MRRFFGIKLMLGYLLLGTLIFCASSENKKLPKYLAHKLNVLIRDEVLLDEIKLTPDSIILEDSLSRLAFALIDTTKLFQLYKHFTFTESLELIKTPRKSDSILADQFFTVELDRSTKPRVALDPGHLAGDFEEAKFEDKFIEFANSDISFFEAKLTYATALKIKHDLEAQGVEVMMTHEYGKPCYALPFDVWYQKHFYTSLDSMRQMGSLDSTKVKWLTKLYEGDSDYGRKVIFHRMYKQIDLRERARKINAFKPDLSLIIHYNVDDKNQDWEKPTSKNYQMMFVPGSFMEGELLAIEDKEQFLRLLLTEDEKRSIHFSSDVVLQMKEKINVPIAADTAVATYLSKYCLPTAREGVFSRNLSLTRLVEGVICYGETLYQDNILESVELSKNDCEIEGMNISCRIFQVADAYTQAILNYLEENTY